MRFRIVFRLASVLTILFLLAGEASRAQEGAAGQEMETHQRAAQEAEGRGDFKTAAHEYGILAGELPQNAELQSNLGVALYFNHDLHRATTVFRQAISLKEGLYTPHLFLGVAMVRLSQPDAAVKELKRAIAINSSDPLAHTWLGYALVAQGRYDLAVEQLETARKQQPNNVDVEYALGQAYLELGKRATAELIRLLPDGGRTWQLAAEQAEAQGNREKALSMYQAAIERRPDVAEIQAKVKELQGSDGTTESARGPLSRPLRVESAESPRAEDEAYARVLEYERKSKDAFERLSRIDGTSYRAHEVLADGYVAADRYDDAILEYRKVLEQKPDLPLIHGALCNALSRTARIQEALAECEAELLNSPENAEAYTQAARVELLANNDVRAEVLLRKALQLDRPPIAAYKQMGKVLLDQRQYRAAAENLQRYLAVETKDSSGYYLLSRAYKGLGDNQRMNVAIAAYKRCLESSHASSDARKVLEPVAPEDQHVEEGERP